MSSLPSRLLGSPSPTSPQPSAVSFSGQPHLAFTHSGIGTQWPPSIDSCFGVPLSRAFVWGAMLQTSRRPLVGPANSKPSSSPKHQPGIGDSGVRERQERTGLHPPLPTGRVTSTLHSRVPGTLGPCLALRNAGYGVQARDDAPWRQRHPLLPAPDSTSWSPESLCASDNLSPLEVSTEPSHHQAVS